MGWGSPAQAACCGRVKQTRSRRIKAPIDECRPPHRGGNVDNSDGEKHSLLPSPPVLRGRRVGGEGGRLPRGTMRFLRGILIPIPTPLPLSTGGEGTGAFWPPVVGDGPDASP